jgi:hypothetical protein
VDYFTIAEEHVDLFSLLGDEWALKSDFHLDGAYLKARFEAFPIFLAILLSIAKGSEAFQYISTRYIVNKGLKILEDSCTWRLINI